MPNESQINDKHLVYFFGLFESTELNSEENKFNELILHQNINIHLFDYNYFAKVVKPKIKLSKCLPVSSFTALLTINVALGISFYLYFSHRITYKNTTIYAVALLFMSFITIITSVISNYITHKIITESYSTQLMSMDIDTVKNIKKQLTGIVDDKNKKEDIKDITDFLCHGNFFNIMKFCTKGKDPVDSGIKKVVHLLEKGIHPNNIILMGNSMGGAIATEVLNYFEKQNMFLTLINSNSFTNLNDAIQNLELNTSKIKNHPKVLKRFLKFCNTDYHPQDIITSTKSPILVVNRKKDNIIHKNVQAAEYLIKHIKNNKSNDQKPLKAAVLLNHNDEDCIIKDINIHMDTASHMVIEEFDMQCPESNKLNIEKGQTYNHLLTSFINTAQEYLEQVQLNKDYDLDNLKQSELYKKAQKGKLSEVKTISNLSSINKDK